MPYNQLSPHFHEKEFACSCCGRVHVSPYLVDVLESARVIHGEAIHITKNGGFRCPEQNKASHGAPHSAHLTGEAADIACLTSGDRYYFLRIFMALGVKRIGVGKTFVHVDVSKSLLQNVIWIYD